MNLSKEANAKAKKVFKEKMAAEGKKQRNLWATDEEFEAVKSFLEERRKLQKSHEQENFM